jgi:hypothetical protein
MSSLPENGSGCAGGATSTAHIPPSTEITVQVSKSGIAKDNVECKRRILITINATNPKKEIKILESDKFFIFTLSFENPKNAKDAKVLLNNQTIQIKGDGKPYYTKLIAEIVKPTKRASLSVPISLSNPVVRNLVRMMLFDPEFVGSNLMELLEKEAKKNGLNMYEVVMTLPQLNIFLQNRGMKTNGFTPKQFLSFFGVKEVQESYVWYIKKLYRRAKFFLLSLSIRKSGLLWCFPVQKIRKPGLLWCFPVQKLEPDVFEFIQNSSLLLPKMMVLRNENYGFMILLLWRLVEEKKIFSFLLKYILSKKC